MGSMRSSGWRIGDGSLWGEGPMPRTPHWRQAQPEVEPDLASPEAPSGVALEPSNSASTAVFPAPVEVPVGGTSSMDQGTPPSAFVVAWGAGAAHFPSLQVASPGQCALAKASTQLPLTHAVPGSLWRKRSWVRGTGLGAKGKVTRRLKGSTPSVPCVLLRESRAWRAVLLGSP